MIKKPISKSPPTRGRRHHVFLSPETIILLAEYGRIACHPSIVGQVQASVHEVLTSRGIDCDGVIHRAKESMK